MSTNLFPKILGYTQNLNHHVSITSNNAADVSKVFVQSGDEEATVSSKDREVQGMLQIGEALLIGDNSNLYAFEGDIQKQLQQEEADWRAVH
ncbi:hypothetical protein POTOM_005282 [Populus tomentosa]|uniref:Uncharacterized protein n=1 Tax=Populus tomentosa TaxID=118781 RepID=A0A8X8ALL6_POPTO|nr:hypothetical protein POTOM_005282 [Populus tomentosa]